MPLHHAPPCETCGALYLAGTFTTCARCLRLKKQNRTRVDTSIRFRCDCGQIAAAVILITVGNEESLSQQRMPLCENCLELEKEIQSALDRLHISHRSIDPQRNTPNKSTLDLPDSDHPYAWLRHGRFIPKN